MQLASWLLLHRAVNEGEMSLAQANKEKAKVKLSAGDRGGADMVALLPERLRALIDRSVRLQERVRRLDSTIHSRSRTPTTIRSNAKSACCGAFDGRVARRSRIGRPRPRSSLRLPENERSGPSKAENFFWEARQPAAASAAAAGRRSKGRMRLRSCRGAIVSPACPGGAGRELGPVGHHDLESRWYSG